MPIRKRVIPIDVNLLEGKTLIEKTDEGEDRYLILEASTDNYLLKLELKGETGAELTLLFYSWCWKYFHVGGLRHALMRVEASHPQHKGIPPAGNYTIDLAVEPD